MRSSQRMVATAVGVSCICIAMSANAQYTDTVDLGSLPSNTVSLQLFNSYETSPTAYAQYSDSPQQWGIRYSNLYL